MEAILQMAPDLVILDLSLPDFDGIEVLARVRDAGHRPKVLVVSGFANPHLVFRLERARVNGFVDKGIHAEAGLREALNAVLSNRTYFSDTYVRLQDERRRNPFSFDKLLTNQQLVILAFVAHRFGDGEIAERLEISRRTAETHRQTVMRKLGVRSVTELMRYAHESGFTSGSPPFVPPNPVRTHRLLDA